MKKRQHRNHVFCVLENGKKKYILFNYIVAKNTCLDETTNNFIPSVSNSILSSRMDFIDNIKQATVLNNNPKSERYKATSEIHAIFENSILNIADKIKIIPIGK